MNTYKEIHKQTPNISNRNMQPTGIVLHHTAGSFDGSVNWCLRKESKVSYHTIIDLDGSRTILAKDNQITWHAGKSSFKGMNLCNNFMLGFAVSGDTYRRLLTEDEIESVALLCIDKMRLYNFGVDWITTHRRVSPNRKVDIDVRAEEAIINRIKELLSEQIINHTVVAGETLFSISHKYKVSIDAIKSINTINDNFLFIGQKLKIK
jgi:hypothetical protein